MKNSPFKGTRPFRLSQYGLPILTALALLSDQARAQIALQDGSDTVNWVSANNETIPVTVTSGASVLVVLLENRSTGATIPASLSWNGVTLTNAIQEQHSATTQRGEAIYYVYNPPVTGAGTPVNLAVTDTGAGTLALTAYTLSGVNTSVPPLVGGTNTGSSGGEALIPFSINNILNNSWAAVNMTTSGAGAIYTMVASNATTDMNVTAGDYNDTGNGNVQQAGYVGPLSAGTITFTATSLTTYSDKDNYEAAVFTPAGEFPPPVNVISVVPSTNTPALYSSVTVTATINYFNSTPSPTATLNASGLNPSDSAVTLYQQSVGSGVAIYTNTVTVAGSAAIGTNNFDSCGQRPCE